MPELSRKLPTSAVQSTYSLVSQLNNDSLISVSLEVSLITFFKHAHDFRNVCITLLSYSSNIQYHLNLF